MTRARPPALQHRSGKRAARDVAVPRDGRRTLQPRAYEESGACGGSARSAARRDRGKTGFEGSTHSPPSARGSPNASSSCCTRAACGTSSGLREATPIDVSGLTAVEGLGPKTAKILYEELGIRDVRALEKACREGRGPRASALRRKDRAEHPERNRVPRGRGVASSARSRAPARPARSRGALHEIAGVEQAAVAGLGAAPQGDDRRPRLPWWRRAIRERSPRPRVDARRHARVCARRAKTLVRLANGMDADLRVVPAASFGVLRSSTSPAARRTTWRCARIAQLEGLKLNEYGLFRGRAPAGRGAARRKCIGRVGLPFVPPELREDTGETRPRAAGRLPGLIEHGELRGDLQIQTDWTDGAASIESDGRWPRRRSASSTSRSPITPVILAMARGCDEAKLLEQAEAIRKLNRRLRGFRVFSGAEVNIREDGSLDVADEALAQLEVVGAAIHARFRQSKTQMTAPRAARHGESPRRHPVPSHRSSDRTPRGRRSRRPTR